MDISLYGILDLPVAGDRPLSDLAAAAARGGATMLQLRFKDRDLHWIVEACRLVLEDPRVTVPVVFNDNTETAQIVGAHGVHLGQGDGSPIKAREVLGPDKLIGLTINSIEDAMNAPVDVINYACIGGVFDTTSKDTPRAIGIDGWKARATILRKRAPDLPVGAIAGITVENAGDLIRAGADGVAVISAMFGPDDVEGATRKLAQAIADARNTA